ncbi:MAG: ornithine carbamoyltransferase [Ilumatobacteraceae bacterium]
MTILRHFTDITDVDAAGLRAILALAERPALPLVLERQGVALIFEKPSNRTRHSTEMAVVQLGGHPVYTRGEEVGLDERESVEDITRVLAGYHAALAARVFEHDKISRMAAVSTVPVVNMLSDRSHPLQAVADVLTMQQVHGDLTGRTVAYVGDYANVSRSLAEACLLLGVHVTLAAPEGYGASADELARLDAIGANTGARVTQSTDPSVAVEGAIAVHTDTWVSMGLEDEKVVRVEAFRGYTVDSALMARAASGAGFYHCLPAYRGLEVTTEVIDGPCSHVIAQAHNRLHAARGVLAWLKGVR